MALSPQAREVIRALTDLYRTILHMSNTPESDLQTAPEEGFTLPSNLQQALDQRKSSDVISLLRRLPFAPIQLGPSAAAIDYSREDDYFFHQAWRPMRFGYPDNDAVVLEHELPLTGHAEEVGIILVIDTQDWSARSYHELYSGSDCNAHADLRDCPPLCRYQKGLEVKPAVQMLEEWKNMFIESKWMVDRHAPDVIDQSWPEEYIEKLQEVYASHGWPDNFRAAECRRVLEELPDPDDDYYMFGDE